MKKKISVCLLFVFLLVCLCGCGVLHQENKEKHKLDFTVLAPEDVPIQCETQIEKEKKSSFGFTFSDEQFLYICVGYGEQKSSGYSVCVNDLYVAGEEVYVDTTLIGPKQEERTEQINTYPYIVIKTEYIEQNVIFDSWH